MHGSLIDVVESGTVDKVAEAMASETYRDKLYDKIHKTNKRIGGHMEGYMNITKRSRENIVPALVVYDSIDKTIGVPPVRKESIYSAMKSMENQLDFDGLMALMNELLQQNPGIAVYLVRYVHENYKNFGDALHAIVIYKSIDEQLKENTRLMQLMPSPKQIH